jgi:hypothetical protein
MSTDYLLREQFVTNPAQVMSEYLHGKALAPEQASVASQLIYSVMSNRALLGWLREYAISHRGRIPPKDRVAADFGRAVVQHGGDHVALALMRASAEQAGIRVLDDALLDAVFISGMFFERNSTV